MNLRADTIQPIAQRKFKFKLELEAKVGFSQVKGWVEGDHSVPKVLIYLFIKAS